MVPSPAPSVVVLGGPNGAGKSTAAPRLLRGTLRVDEFVNADTLAQGLSAFRPEEAAIEAGRIMLRRLDHLASRRMSFAFEMSKHPQSIDELFDAGHPIDEALRLAAQDARRLHKRLGNPMATWRDGQVV